MEKRWWLVSLAVLLFAGTNGGGHASSLRIEPVTVDVTAPGAAATLTLRNDGREPIDIQMRVFRWSQVDGKEVLEPTTDVVASPPMVKVAPGGDYVARIVRVTKRRIAGEESYRLLIDQLPALTQGHTRTVNLLLRHSIPVFFASASRRGAAVAWSVSVAGGKITVTARNDGDQRLRIASLEVRDGRGKTFSLGKGLVGYALGRSSMDWAMPVGAGGFSESGSVSIAAASDQGPIHAIAAIGGRR